MIAAGQATFWDWFWPLLCLGALILLLAVKAERSFRAIRDALGKLLARAHELEDEKISSNESFERWRGDLHAWIAETNTLLQREFSQAHATTFRDLGPGNHVVKGQFNAEHAALMNTLGKYAENLRRILERYLTTRS